jgi:hypothetical protein
LHRAVGTFFGGEGHLSYLVFSELPGLALQYLTNVSLVKFPVITNN